MDQKANFLTGKTSAKKPISFNPELVPEGRIVHRGIFSSDLKSYYFTVSDPAFTNFDILESHDNEGWTTPQKAFFNSTFDDHGMSFSPDGQTLVFSSTRPVGKKHIPNTWHIWRCTKIGENWSKPEYIEIPNLWDKLISHPTIMPDGTIYFHASEPDYSSMNIYFSKLVDGTYQNATMLTFETLKDTGFCTPYIASSGKHLVFAAIRESLVLYVSENIGDNKWSEPIKLPAAINTNGQGNPYLTPEGRFLFYAIEKDNDWDIQWIGTSAFLGQ